MKLWFYHENITHMHHTNLKWNKLNKFLQVFIHFRTRARGEWRYQWFRAGTGEQYVVRAIHVAVVVVRQIQGAAPQVSSFYSYISNLFFSTNLGFSMTSLSSSTTSNLPVWLFFCWPLVLDTHLLINQTTDKLLTKYIHYRMGIECRSKWRQIYYRFMLILVQTDKI